MNDIYGLQDILNSFCEKGVCQYLAPDKRSYYCKKLIERYCKTNVISLFSFFEMLDFERMLGVDVVDSWKWISDFHTDSSVVVFFNNINSKLVLEVCDCKTICEIYENMPYVEFYVSNYSFDFLIGFNHSQCLITMGSASEWLENDIRYQERYK